MRDGTAYERTITRKFTVNWRVRNDVNCVCENSKDIKSIYLDIYI